MSNSIIKIKRSTGSTPPATLASGELAYAWDEAGGFANGKLFIGTGSETAGAAANVEVIGGKQYINMLDHTAGVVVASSALIVDASKKLNELLVDNITVDGNTISTTNANGNLILNPNGTGLVSIAGAFTLPRTAGSVGQVLSINASGEANWVNMPAGSFTIAGNTGSDLFSTGQTLTVTGSNGLSTAVTDNTITISIVNSVALTGTPTAPTAAGGTNTTQLATTAFVRQEIDSSRAGLDPKESVRAATTANITLSNTQTVDGVALAVGDRVLVKNQTNGADNGIYLVASGAWTRTADASQGTLTSGAYVFVEQGTVNSDSGWTLNTDGAITVGTTLQTWVQFTGAGQITAGNGLTKTGNTLDIGAGTGITVSADAVSLAGQALALHNLATSGLVTRTGTDAFAARSIAGTANRVTVTNGDGISGNPTLDIAATYAGQTSITTLGTITAGTWNGTTIAVGSGGTGLTSIASRAVVFGNGTAALGVTGTSSVNGSFLREDATGNPYWSNVIDAGTY